MFKNHVPPPICAHLKLERDVFGISHYVDAPPSDYIIY